MHKKPPHNPYEPSVRERLAQRDSALLVRAYTVTGKRKYYVSKPVESQAKREINTVFSGSGGYSRTYPILKVPTVVHDKGFILIAYDEWWLSITKEVKWLTDRQATMHRLKGYVVDDE